jgi:hypothetical protein
MHLKPQTLQKSQLLTGFQTLEGMRGSKDPTTCQKIEQVLRQIVADINQLARTWKVNCCIIFSIISGAHQLTSNRNSPFCLPSHTTKQWEL